MQYFKQFHQHLVNRDYSSFLSLWDEYCSSDEVDAAELIKILDDVRISEFGESFGRYVDKALSLWKMFGDTDNGNKIFKLIVDVQTSNDPSLGQLVFEHAHKKYAHHKHFDQMQKLVGLRDLKNFQGALSNLELLAHMHKNNFVYHSGGWGVGEIMDVSFLREQLSLEFDYVAGKKDLSFQNAFKTLIPIPKDHFLARRFGNPDNLEVFARENPTELIKMLLKDLGPRSAAEIKEELCELVIPEEEWTKWWQATRTKVKKDTTIEVPEDLKEPFRLRDVEVGHEERLHKALEKKPTIEEFIQLVYSFLRDFSSTLKNEEFKSSLKVKLAEALASKELSDAQELQIRFFLEDLAAETDQSVMKQLIERFRSLDHILASISVIAFKKRFLVEIKKRRGDWADIFYDLIWQVDQNPLRDYILDELLKAGKDKQVTERLHHLLSHPGQYPQALIWYFKKIMSSKTKIPFSNQEGKNRFLESFFILLSILDKSGPTNRDLAKKMLTFITSGRYAVIRKIFQGADIDHVQEFLLLATKCLSFTNHDIKIFHSLAEVVHPALEKLRKKYEGYESEEDLIWTTEAGLNKIKTRIEEIATVETVENAKEIEVARSHGDLRENSEFKFALEKRDRLQGELKFLSEQLNKARVISKEEVSLDSVGIGVIVDCLDEKGKSVSYTLLGPWDANTEENILSFQSKLAQDMKGLKVGDNFKVQNKSYTIKKLRNFFAEK
jgi:transcription elongation factor GreA-like protein/transcription elongation GreA/GreB family factor